MSRLVAFGELLNPVAWRELRRSVEGRLAGAGLGAMLLSQLAILWMLAMVDDGRALRHHGRDVFMWMFGLLSLVVLLLVPIAAAISARAERSTQGLDLVFTTALGPGALIRGRLFAACAVCSLLISACLPVLTLCYFLGGIDLRAVFLVVFALFCFVALVTLALQVVVLLQLNKVLEALVWAGAILGLVMSWGFGLAISEELLRGGGNLFGISVGSSMFWRNVSLVFALAGGLGYLLFALAVAAIAPVASNRGIRVRLAMLVCWLLSLGICALDGSDDSLGFWALVWSLGAGVTALVAASERRRFGPRVLSGLPKRRGLLRLIMLLLSSGITSGFVFATGFAGLTVLTAWTLGPTIWSSGDRFGQFILGCAGCYLGFLAFALFGAAWAERSERRLDKHGGALALAAMTFCAVTPPLIGSLIVGGGGLDSLAWYLLNPFAAFERDFVVPLTLLFGALSVVLAFFSRRRLAEGWRGAWTP